MDNVINERIRRLMFDKKMNASEFSRAIGLTNNTTISRLINQPEINPSFKVIQGILEAFPLLSAEWLMKGEGGMFKKETEESMAHLKEPQEYYGGNAVMKEILKEMKLHNKVMEQIAINISR